MKTDELLTALNAIAQGYKVAVYDDRWIQVQNPAFVEDRGNNTHLVIDVHALNAPTHRHKKRGTEYVLIGIGKMQAEYWWELGEQGHGPGGSVDMREVAVYRSATDPTEIWVRPREEFEDGRFEALEP